MGLHSEIKDIRIRLINNEHNDDYKSTETRELESIKEEMRDLAMRITKNEVVINNLHKRIEKDNTQNSRKVTD